MKPGHHVRVRVDNPKHKLNGRTFYFWQEPNDRYTVVLEGSTESIRIRPLKKGEREVVGTNSARIKVPVTAKWVAVARTHWRGSVDVLGVVAFASSAKDAFRFAFPVVWP